jgi:predicted RNA-binding Zn-ribbon protein involved in translation (DUF1610 family)
MSRLQEANLAPEAMPRPPACPSCGAKMQLITVDANESKYTNLDLWSYRCEPCRQTASNYVARKISKPA